MDLVSVTMNPSTKMKALPLLFILTIVSAEQFITMRLNDLVEKYRHQAWGNAEFSRWIEQAYYAGKKPMGHKAEKKKILDQFMVYDTQRQYLEDRITDRMNEIDSLLPNRKLSQICVTEYQAQKDRLRKAYKYTNAEKQRILDQNSKFCSTPDAPPPTAPPATAPPRKLYSYEIGGKKGGRRRKSSSSTSETVVYNHWYSWWWG